MCDEIALPELWKSDVREVDSTLFLRLYQVFVKAYGSGEAVVLDVFIETMHSFHLLRAEYYRSEPDTVFANRLIELCIRSTGHYIGVYDSLSCP